jgi:nitroreductase
MNQEQKLSFILGRRSVRVYSPGVIPDSTVTTMLEAAMAAPSAMTKDPWRFVVIRDTAMLGSLAAGLPGGKMLSTVGLAIVVCGDVEASFEQNVGYLVQDCSAAVENLLLAAHALELGACWVGIYPSEKQMRSVEDLLGLPGNVLPLACIAVGHKGEDLEPRTRFDAQKVKYETWVGARRMKG